MNLEELTNLFSYHKPFGDQEVRYDIIRSQAKTLAIHIEKWCPRSREKSLAITKLQECVMMANAAIAIHEVEVVPDEERPIDEAGEFPSHDSLPDGPQTIRDENVKAEKAQKEAQMREERDEQWKAERDEQWKAERDEEAVADEREQIETEEEGL